MNKLPLWHMAYSHCCNSSKLRCHSDLDSENDKYQTGVAKLPTGTISKWLNVIHVQRHFATTSFFLIALGGFFWYGDSEYLSVREPNDDEITKGKFSCYSVLNDCGSLHFIKNILQGSEGRHITCNGYFNTLYKFTHKSISERILKIGLTDDRSDEDVTELLLWVWCLPFSGHRLCLMQFLHQYLRKYKSCLMQLNVT